MNIAGHHAIITGGASGLGKACAEHLTNLGAKLTLIDMNAQACQAVATQIHAHAIIGDVADDTAMSEALSSATSRFGPCRVLINCAGIGIANRMVGRDGPMPLAQFEKVIRVNLIGTFNMMRLVGAHMSLSEPLPNGERGVIVSTASVAAFEGQIGQAAYSASKGGIAALTLPVARELAQFGIRVMTIAPGLFLTPLLQNLPEEAQKSLGASIPFPKRLGHAAEFASLVGHIVENDFLNGEVIRLDGALRLPPK
ncbi:MAG: SDR family NAD(P)-dependent oxidoreductase [Methylocystaceae bacterium]|nr:SDR family NAD(P)-dependent oxidoreductase [Methylocystaceae bacterium]